MGNSFCNCIKNNNKNNNRGVIESNNTYNNDNTSNNIDYMNEVIDNCNTNLGGYNEEFKAIHEEQEFIHKLLANNNLSFDEHSLIMERNKNLITRTMELNISRSYNCIEYNDYCRYDAYDINKLDTIYQKINFQRNPIIIACKFSITEETRAKWRKYIIPIIDRNKKVKSDKLKPIIREISVIENASKNWKLYGDEIGLINTRLQCLHKAHDKLSGYLTTCSLSMYNLYDLDKIYQKNGYVRDKTIAAEGVYEVVDGSMHYINFA